MDWSPHPKVCYERKCTINEFCRFPFDIEESKLELNTKISALQTAQSIVSLKSYSDKEQLFICCGIIMECEDRDETSYIATILTSASLLRPPDAAAKLATNLKIHVYGVGGKLTEGKVGGIDFHYNLATIEIRSHTPLPVPQIRLVDNVVEVGPTASLPRSHHPYSVATSNRFRLYPGDKVLALARYFQEPYDIMVASGEYSSGDCLFDCKELLRTSCKIKKNGIGGPLINLYGQVIGINFYTENSFTPFLPMNIIVKWFEDLKNNRHVLRPSLGVEINDLHVTSLDDLESFCYKFPHVCKGATITKVLPDSPGHIAGLCSDDVIINCAGASVGSSLELTEVLWGKEGKPIELVVARPSTGELVTFFVNALVSSQRENRWPVPKPRRVISDHLSWMYKARQ